MMLNFATKVHYLYEIENAQNCENFFFFLVSHGSFNQAAYLGSGGITHFFIENHLHDSYNGQPSTQASEL